MVLWPHAPLEIEGETVYPYVIMGMVMTNKPIEWPNESIVMDGSHSATITELLDNLIKHQPSQPLGDANEALMALARMTPNDLKDFEANEQ